MTDYSLIFPAEFDDYASEVESKGWFSDVRLNFRGRRYGLTFYDPVRLGQEIEGEHQRGDVFFEPNLVVVRSVTRQNMEKAVEILIQSGRVNSLIAE